jgi:hypothetical protein
MSEQARSVASRATPSAAMSSGVLPVRVSTRLEWETLLIYSSDAMVLLHVVGKATGAFSALVGARTGAGAFKTGVDAGEMTGTTSGATTGETTVGEAGVDRGGMISTAGATMGGGTGATTGTTIGTTGAAMGEDMGGMTGVRTGATGATMGEKTGATTGAVLGEGVAAATSYETSNGSLALQRPLRHR